MGSRVPTEELADTRGEELISVATGLQEGGGSGPSELHGLSLGTNVEI